MSIWKGRLKSICSFQRKHPSAGRHTNCEPSTAGRSWKGGAREQADDVFFALRIKTRRSKANFAPTWKGRLKSILGIGRTVAGESPNRPSGRRYFCAVRAFCRRQNLGAGGIHFRRAFGSPEGGAVLRAAEPKKRDICFQQMSLFLEGTVKIDISVSAKTPARRATHQLRAQRSGSQLEARSSKMSAR